MVLKDIPRSLLLAGAFLLPWAAGFVNVIALEGFTHGAVSHVTGLVSHTTFQVVRSDLPLAFRTLSVVGAFFVGAVVSGMIVGDEALRLGRRYGVSMLLEGILLALSARAFQTGQIWGEWTAAMACGLQNAMVATYSGAVIRSTHLTGVVSDLGSIAGNLLAGRAVNGVHALLLSTILIGFVVGGLSGAAGYLRWGYAAMYLPALAVAAAGGAYWMYRQRVGPAGLSPER